MAKNYKAVDMNRHPKKPIWFWKIVILILTFFFSGPFATRTKIKKHNFKSFKEPGLIISNHGSFVDMSNLSLAMFPHLPCYVIAIDEMIGREWILRQIGCFPKRKFTTDLSMIRTMNTVINKDKCWLALYPEARWSFAGTNEDIGDSIGKMVKLCKCRVVVVNQKGNFLRSPQWNKHPYRKVRNYVDIYEVVTKEESLTLSAEEIQKRIEEKFNYDEYKWQSENKVAIKSKYRAHKLHQILYKCPHCNQEGHMYSNKTKLWCEKCNTSWEMNDFGELIQQNNGESRFKLVTDWYRWEREEVNKEVENGTYFFEDEVRLEKLINCQVKFKTLGTVKMTHNEKGYTLEGTLDDGTPFFLNKPCLSTRSVHVEFDYKGKGNCVDIATLEETWFAYPLNDNRCICKFNFATEALFFKSKTK